ncbi:tetratricopeptide repeat protein [Telmatobacter sp. DSM 110680]|uniref:Tetratricopeptide repeat protein n=1 Tax=Telmatobacter sp. DSM 110680 TaxID=3036704 RepID=A0AAU7DGL1_9BACT
MIVKLHNALGIGCVLIAAVGLHAQATQPAQQPKPPANTQPAQKPSSEANPFPEDTKSVPVVPTNGEATAAPAPPADSNDEGARTTSLLKDDSDPARSPDDPPPGASDSDSGFSSSLNGAGDVNIPDEMKPTGKRKRGDEPVVHQVTAKEDEDVGEFELSRKNWKAALSRFQSALVTDPDNPEVYWGIAEAQRQLRDFASAKANYQKVMEYDPDSKHGKEAKKLLKDPELAHAPAVSAIPATATPEPQQ